MVIQSFNNWNQLNEALINNSDDVKQLQMMLIDMGYSLPKHGADGVYGEETKAAVRSLQNNLIKQGFQLPKYGADGYWGEETQDALNRYKLKTTSHKPPGSDSKKEVIDGAEKSANSNLDKQKDSKNKVTVTDGNISHSYSGKAAKNIDKIIEAGKKYGITNPNTLVGVLSIVGKESEFIPQKEQSYYRTRPNALKNAGLWSRLVNQGYTEKDFYPINKQDKDTFDNWFWEAVYGYKTAKGKELGNIEPGDGYKYRGRGFNQLTGKSNYRSIGKEIGKDLVNNPDLVNDVSIAAEVLFTFLKSAITDKRVKGGLNGFTSVENAVKNIARANAGWGNDYDSGVVKWAIDNANKIKPNFDIA